MDNYPIKSHELKKTIKFLGAQATVFSQDYIEQDMLFVLKRIISKLS